MTTEAKTGSGEWGPGNPEKAVGEVPWDAFTVRLWLPVTLGRPHSVAVGSYSEALELARAKEGGGQHPHADFDVVRVEFVYPGRKAE